VTALAVLLGAGRADAVPVLYATSLEGQQIVKVDVGTSAVTPVFTTVGQPDSMIFTPDGNIVYSSISNGQIRLYNVTTKTDTPLASGLGAQQDLVLDPGSKTVTFSNAGPGLVERVSLSGGPVTVLNGGNNYGGNVTGLAYDAAGHLFLNIPNGTHVGISQIDPNDGHIIHSSPQAIGGFDGLTYDPFSHLLYATNLGANQAYAIDPTTLLATPLANFSVPGPDGIVADGQGNLFIASRGNFHIYEYNLLSMSQSQKTQVFGLDDLAPLVGPGAPTPEPSTLLLMGSLGLGMVCYGWYRRKQAA
jgi:hypothetical protein